MGYGCAWSACKQNGAGVDVRHVRMNGVRVFVLETKLNIYLPK